jgi:tryptophanyl-tRNA synthetase
MSAEPSAESARDGEMKVDPWAVEGDVDYDRLIAQFGCHRIDQPILDRMERLTGKKPHRFLRRGIFFSHRDLNHLLDLYELGEPFYLYTGRGPSSDSMHTGHLVPFLFTKWLQDTFNVPLVIQITDDEKFFFKDLTIEAVEKLAKENIKDIIALGFRKDLTFIFQDFEYMGHMYRTVARLEKAFTNSQVKGCFGFKGEDNMGKWLFPAVQAAPSFSCCFPHIFPQPPDGKATAASSSSKQKKKSRDVFCLIPQAIDQDPYFRLTRDVAQRLGFLKPALIHSKFFPGLTGSKGKMSSSVGAAVFLTDTEKSIKDKINKHAFSGGGATKEEHLLLGGNCDVDVPLQWLGFFLEDDAQLAELTKDYALGRITTGDVKKALIGELWAVVKAHQDARKLVTDDIVRDYMAIRPMGPMLAELQRQEQAKAAVSSPGHRDPAPAAAS